LGGRANGTALQVAANSSIKEYDLNVMHGMDHVRALLDSLASMANAAREAIDQCDNLEDHATADVFTEIVRAADADKDIFFLQSHLQGGITTYGR
jgi:DNA-binding ferritin-like protein